MIAAFEARVPKGDDLADRVASIQVGYVINHLAATTHTKINIDIRQRHPAAG